MQAIDMMRLAAIFAFQELRDWNGHNVHNGPSIRVAENAQAKPEGCCERN